MSLNTLQTAYLNGEVIDASHINELTSALLGQFVGRDPNGVPTPGQSLGTLAIPWGNMYATGIILNGLALDTSAITSLPNRIVSSKTRALSSMPDFLRANGAALEFDILGASVDLVLSINNTAVSISSDLNKTGVVAAPAANNTAAINNTLIVSDLYAGESDASIPELIIDAVGAEVSSRVGQIVAFKAPTGEIFQGLLKTATLITTVFRGYYFDDSGNPLPRGSLSNNDTITLMNIGWVFVEDNGTTVDVATLTPVIAYNAPSGPATGQYWFDITNQVWKRYSGTSFDIINRILIGQVISDDTNTIASRSWDISNPYDVQNNIEIDAETTEIVRTKSKSSRCNVYGTEVLVDLTKVVWNITTDLESPLVEASDTVYYLYLSVEGQEIISDEKPFVRSDLKGAYHPFHSWRCIGEVFNDASSDFVGVRMSKYNSLKNPDVMYYEADSHAGYGSTATMIPYFSNVTRNEGQLLAIINNDSTDSWFLEPLVAKVLVHMSGVCRTNVDGQEYGLTVDADPTVAFPTIPIAEIRAMAYATQGIQISAPIVVNKGEKLRLHGNSAGLTTNLGKVILKVESIY